MSMTTPRTDQSNKALNELLPPHAVILHNDEVHSMDFVINALLKSVPEINADMASMIMLEAHNTGRAVVVVCPLETAEFYRDRLATFGLGASIEKA